MLDVWRVGDRIGREENAWFGGTEGMSLDHKKD